MSEADARARIIELCMEFGVTHPNGIHEKMLARILNGEVVTSDLEAQLAEANATIEVLAEKLAVKSQEKGFGTGWTAYQWTKWAEAKAKETTP